MNLKYLPSSPKMHNWRSLFELTAYVYNSSEYNTPRMKKKTASCWFSIFGKDGNKLLNIIKQDYPNTTTEQAKRIGLNWYHITGAALRKGDVPNITGRCPAFAEFAASIAEKGPLCLEQWLFLSYRIICPATFQILHRYTFKDNTMVLSYSQEMVLKLDAYFRYMEPYITKSSKRKEYYTVKGNSIFVKPMFYLTLG